MAPRVYFLAFYFLSNLNTFCTMKKITPKNGLFIMNKPEKHSNEQILNSKDVKARETFSTFESCTEKNWLCRQETTSFHDVTVKFP